MSQLFLAARLAARGIRAYRRRSLQTLLIVALGVALVVLTDSFMAGFSANVMDQILRSNGHLSIAAPGYAEQREIAPIDLFIPDVEALKAGIAPEAARKGAADSLVLAASVRTAGLVSDGERSVTASALGTDPFWQGAVVPSLRDAAGRVQGRFFTPGERGMLVSRRVAEKLGARPGDRLMFLCSDRFGSFGVVEVPLLGVLPRGVTADGEECIMDLASMQAATGLEGAATEVTAWRIEQRPRGPALAGPREASPLLEQASEAARRRGYEARRWEQISASFGSLMSFMDMYLAIMYVIFAVVAAVGMTNSVLLSVQDRFRDIATLRVVALSRAGVSVMIAFESLLLGLCGALLGAIVGGTVSLILERAGMSLRVELESIAAYMGNGIAPRLFPGHAAAAAAVAALVPVLASILPILAIRKLTVREALGAV